MSGLGAALHGKEQVKRNLEALIYRCRDAMAAAQFYEAEKMLDRVKPLIPRKTGALWNARYIQTFAGPRTKTIRTKVGFLAYYASAVEHRLNVKHLHGQAKFFATALHQTAAGYAPRIADRAKSFLARNIGLELIRDILPTVPAVKVVGAKTIAREKAQAESKAIWKAAGKATRKRERTALTAKRKARRKLKRDVVRGVKKLGRNVSRGAKRAIRGLRK